MSKLVKHIKESLKKTDLCRSNITVDILKMEGMSGKKTRHFYNNICSMEDARYLEIGTWKGSSICAAMCGNQMRCVCIDNWSEFGGPKEEFLVNFNKYKGKNNARFIEKNCWDVAPGDLGTFNMYMYDGNHTQTSHFQAINHFLPCLDDEFLYLVDDWNWVFVQKGTLNAIKENKINIVWKKEILTTTDNSHPEPSESCQSSEWHNGICIFVLKKQ